MGRQELYQMMLEYAFAFTEEVEVHLIVDGDTALAGARRAFAAMAAGG